MIGFVRYHVMSCCADEVGQEWVIYGQLRCACSGGVPGRRQGLESEEGIRSLTGGATRLILLTTK